MADAQAADLPRGRTEPLDPAEADRLFREGVALFNGARYWHAHEVWETLWRAAPDEERDFYQGLIQIAAGFLHLARRNRRGRRSHRHLPRPDAAGRARPDQTCIQRAAQSTPGTDSHRDRRRSRGS